MTQSINIPATLANRALSGDAHAQFELAELYMQSEQDDDIVLAEEWALKAAEQGHVEAMYWLGEGYTFYAKDVQNDDPEDAEQHFTQGLFWLKQAVSAQHPAAILELAGYYRRGNIVDQDVAKSVTLVEQAAKLGEEQAMRDLSAIYAHGLGVAIDEEKATYWAEQAEKNNQA